MAIVLSAVVPAYNEEATIGEVVKTLVKSGVFQDVLVVDDGSTDQTAVVAEQAGASSVVRLPQNSGKGRALAAGVRRTDADVLCFIDADLIGLQAKHVQALVEPVLEGGRLMNIGTVDRGSVLNFLSSKLPPISGQRALRRQVFEKVPARHVRGYGIESALNYSCHSAGQRPGRIYLLGVSVRRKTQKVGIWAGLWNYARMCWRVLGRMLMVRLDRHSFEKQ